MLRQLTQRVRVDLFMLLIMIFDDGYSNIMHEVLNGYDTIYSTNITVNSFLQCAYVCEMSRDCMSIDYKENNSQCFTITRLNTDEDGIPKYVKLVGKEAVFDNSSYFLSAVSYNGIYCQSVCQQMIGYYLTTVGSEAENNFIVNFVGQGRTSIGGMKQAGSTQYEWLNGEPWNYTNWSPYRWNPPIETAVVVTYWNTHSDAWDKWEERSINHRLICTCVCEKDLQ